MQHWILWSFRNHYNMLICHHLLLQNVTVYVGIHVFLNEPQLPSTSRRGTISLVLLTRASPHMLDTIWVKRVYLRLIRPQDMAPVIHALGQVVFSKLFAGFLVSQLQKRLPSGTTAIVAVCDIWSEHWQADLPLLQPIKQCWQHSCVCFLNQLLHLTHSTRTQLLWSALARPVLSETRLGKPLYDLGHCTVTQFQAVTELLIA